MKKNFLKAISLLRHRHVAPFLVILTLLGLINHMRHFERWAWMYETYAQEKTPNKEDDSDYAVLAEHFWRVPHDKGLSVASEPWRNALEIYPFRGIGHGTVQLVLRRYFQDNWRIHYVYFAAFLEFLGILCLSAGLAVFLGSIWVFPFVAYFFVKFSPFLDVLSLRVTEGLLRGAIPLAAGLFLLAGGLMLRKQSRAKITGVWILYFFPRSL